MLQKLISDDFASGVPPGLPGVEELVEAVLEGVLNDLLDARLQGQAFGAQVTLLLLIGADFASPIHPGHLGHDRSVLKSNQVHDAQNLIVQKLKDRYENKSANACSQERDHDGSR